jgi:3-hydroxyisobutyrate dehydrogenase
MPSGIVEEASVGKILVDHSTISPAATHEMANRPNRDTGMAWVDASVTGGTMAATAGDLVIMAGGDAATVEKVRRTAEHLSRRLPTRAQGAGQVTKLCHNGAVASLHCVIAEMVALACNGLSRRLKQSTLAAAKSISGIIPDFRGDRSCRIRMSAKFY